MPRAWRDADSRIGTHLHWKRAPAQWGCAGGSGAALAAIHDAGGGLVEAYPEQVEGRAPQRGAYFHTGPADLFEEFGFERDRKIAKWRWVMRLRIRSDSVPADPLPQWVTASKGLTRL